MIQNLTGNPVIQGVRLNVANLQVVIPDADQDAMDAMVIFANF